MKVYLLNTYDEYGPEEPRATLDKSRVLQLLLTHPHYGKCTDKYKAECLADLPKILEEGGEFGGGGWGGFQLHVIELE